jgi:hypothetical protein
MCGGVGGAAHAVVAAVGVELSAAAARRGNSDRLVRREAGPGPLAKFI